MKKTWKKKKVFSGLMAAVTLSVMTGMYSTSAYAADYNAPITGDASADTAYTAVIGSDGAYTFTDPVVNINGKLDNSAAMHVTGAKNVVINNKNGVINFANKGNVPNLFNGVFLNQEGKVTINANEVKVDAANDHNVRGVNGIYLNGEGATATELEINGKLNVNAISKVTNGNSSFEGNVHGLYARANSSVVVNGDVVMKGADGGYGVTNGGYYDDGAMTQGLNSVGIMGDNRNNNASADGGKITVNGNVDLKVNGSGIISNGGGSEVIVNGGGNIEIAKNNTAINYAIAAANGGVVEVNSAGNSPLVVTGNIGVIKEAYGDELPTDLTVNFKGKESKLNGIAFNGFVDPTFATLTMGLSDGATWTNEVYGATHNRWSGEPFTGSEVTQFNGGADANHAGYIIQKDKNALTIDNYSGHTVVVYEHKVDGTQTDHYTAGNTIISKATAGSGITLSTDSTGIKMDDKATVEAVLNALAGKLIYEEATQKVNNLAGKVQIASGLTSAAQALQISDIKFDAATGQGSIDTTVDPMPPAKYDYTTAITGNAELDKEYEAVRTPDGKYVFKGSQDVTITAENGIIPLGNMTVDTNGTALNINATKAGIYDDANYDNTYYDDTKAVINASEVNVNVNGTGEFAAGIGVNGTYIQDEVEVNTQDGLNIYVHNKGQYGVGGSLSANAYGIVAKGKGNVVVNGNVNMKGNGENQWGVSLDESGGMSHSSAVGIYAEENWDGTGKVTVNGDVDMAVKGSGVYVSDDKTSNKSVPEVNLKGNTTILVDKDFTYRGDKVNVYSLVTRGGDINVNVNDAKDAATNKTVKLNGNIGVLQPNAKVKGNINLGLSNAQSHLTGLVYNTGRDNGKGGVDRLSSFNMYLQNGATWNNEDFGNVKTEANGKVPGFNGSFVNKLSGGSDVAHAGVVVQKDNRNITIDDFSGNVKFIYAHTGAGDFSALGDTVINKAAAGSVVTMSTDSVGIDMTSKVAVEDVLNKLAGKLVYMKSAADQNLTGKVEIASGLTSSAKSLQVGDIQFKEDHHGEYKPGSMNPGIEENVDKFDLSIVESAQNHGDVQKRQWGNSGIRKYETHQGPNGEYNLVRYEFTKDTVITEQANDGKVPVYSDFVNDFGAIDWHGYDNGVINMNNHKLTVNAQGNWAPKVTTRGIRVFGAHLTIDNVAGLDINVTGANNSGEGIYVRGSKTQGSGMAVNYGNGNAHLTINNGYEKGNEVKIDHVKNGVNNHAILVKKNGVSATLDINGRVDLHTSGDSNRGVSNIEGKVFIGGGNIVAENAHAVYNSGDMNLNTTVGKKGEILGGSHDLYIKGGLNNAGSLNVAFDTKDSMLHGGITNNGTANMILSNGAQWKHENTWNDPGFGGSSVTSLKGGDSAANAGVIYHKDKAGISIGNYSGHTTVVYEHTGNGTQAADYAAGNTTINKAAAGSGITVSTDSTGINMQDNAEVAKVMNALAGKLFYKDFVNGAKDLTGKVQIASGLTSAAQSLKLGDITFIQGTGQGSYVDSALPPVPPTPVYPENQTKVEFADSITGDAATDKAYLEGGVLKQDTGIYKFTEPASKVVINGVNGAIDAVKDVTIDATGKNLELVSNGDNPDGKNPITALDAGKHNVDITADNVTIKATNASQRAEGIRVTGEAAKKAEVNINANTTIVADGKDYALGAYVAGNSELNFNGNLTIKGENGAWGVDDHSDAKSDWEYYSVSGLYAGYDQNSKAGGSEINVNGNLDMAVNGTGVLVNGGDAEINLNGSTIITTNKDAKSAHYALNAQSGTINVNMNAGQKAAGNNKVVLNGNVAAMKDGWPASDSYLNIGMATEDSVLNGVVVNNYTDKQAQKGEVNLYMSNGATWNNEVYGQVIKKFDGSKVNKLVGGSDAKTAGAVVQKDAGAITINDYSGHMKFIYAHEIGADGKADFSKLGDTVIKNAAVGSSVVMSTDSVGIDMTSDKAVEDVLNKLAGKLMYMNAAADKNLTGKVQIASGLTSAAESLQFGDIAFGADGKGDYVEGTMKPGLEKPEPPKPPVVDPDKPVDPKPPVVDPDKPVDPKPPVVEPEDNESAMMKGTRAAMADSMLTFRDIAAEGFHRTGELRNGSESGAWARIYGGETKFEGEAAEISSNYQAVQAGFDKEVGDWTMGVAVDYRSGEGDYHMGGEGEHKAYALGVYGTKDMGNGSYLDLNAKVGKVENDFKAYNEVHRELEGSYSAPGYSLSAQYGKRIENGSSYFEPQMQFTWTHVNSDSFLATSGNESMTVEQDAFDSLVGRIGLEAGLATEHGKAYARLSLNHEFSGDVDTAYLVNAKGQSDAFTSHDLGDTWSEITIGGNYKLGKCANFYADVTKALTGDYKQDWKANAGVSFSF